MKLLILTSLVTSIALVVACSPIEPSGPGYHPSANPAIQNNPTLISSGNKQHTKDERGHRTGPRNFRTVIIDPGHGGRDSGAKVAGVSEKVLAMDVSRRLRDMLAPNFEVVFLRKGDYFVDLDARVRATKPFNSAILVSIHFNHANSSAVRGAETYYFRVDSYSLAKRLQRNLAAVAPVDNSRGLVRRRLRLTRNTEIPSVLVELGYLSNPAERNLVKNASYRQRLAQAMANAIKEQNARGDAGMGRLPRPLNRPLSRPSDSSQL